MKTQRNWTKITVFVVLALTSLSSIAMTVPHRDHRTVYITPPADVCGEKSVSRFDQYLAAIEWAEQGGDLPFALSVNCVEENLDLTASHADLGGESGERFEQYMAAIEGRVLSLDVAPTRFDQYLAAIEWAERGGELPLALSMSGGEESVDRIVSHPDLGGESGERFEQYMAAIEGTVLNSNAAPACTGVDSQARFDQVLAAIEWAERGGPVPLILSESCGGVTFTVPSPGYVGESWARFEQYMAAIESTGR